MGHSKCGGCKAAIQGKEVGGMLDLYLSHVKEVYNNHFKELEKIKDFEARVDKLGEFNVLA